MIQDSVISKMETTATDGKNYLMTYYRLEATLAVGYRVNSAQATQFRVWATNTLKEFIIKGFVLDDERLKQGKHFGKDYFDDLLERIREIRGYFSQSDPTKMQALILSQKFHIFARKLIKMVDLNSAFKQLTFKWLPKHLIHIAENIVFKKRNISFLAINAIY